MVKMKEYKSKWALLGITKQEYKSIYSKIRSKAKNILKNRHKQEYAFIINELMFKEYKINSAGYELLPYEKQIRIKKHLGLN